MTSQLSPPQKYGEFIDDKEQFKPVENQEEKREKPSTLLTKDEKERIKYLKSLTYGYTLSMEWIKFIAEKRAQRHKIYIPYSYCEKCGFITNELYEMPLSSDNPNPNYSSVWHCKDCRDKKYFTTGKGRIIDEVARRETLRIKYKTTVVEVPQA